MIDEIKNKKGVLWQSILPIIYLGLIVVILALLPGILNIIFSNIWNVIILVTVAIIGFIAFKYPDKVILAIKWLTEDWKRVAIISGIIVGISLFSMFGFPAIAEYAKLYKTTVFVEVWWDDAVTEGQPTFPYIYKISFGKVVPVGTLAVVTPGGGTLTGIHCSTELGWFWIPYYQCSGVIYAKVEIAGKTLVSEYVSMHDGMRYTFSVDVSGLRPGTYEVKVTLYDGDNEPIYPQKSAMVTISG